ncbi:MAG: cell envelope integrity protein TolA [Polaromonas sp.]
MPSAADRLEFGPPRDAGWLRAFGLALLAHILLMAALTWGISWKRSDRAVSFEAELWSSVPQEAAPKLLETPQPPPPPPAPRAPEVKAAPPVPDADIALQQEKKRKLLQQQKEAEAQKAAEKLKAELQAKKEKEQKAKEELAKRKAAEEANKAEAKQQEADAQKLADQRKKNLERLLGQAGASGAADAKGSAQKSGGPSAGYAGRIRARVKPNIVFTEDAAGNPTAEVEVKAAPDGTIMSQRLVKSSGNKAWDDAVIKAVIRTEVLPRDVDGRVPTPMTLVFRLKD